MHLFTGFDEMESPYFIKCQTFIAINKNISLQLYKKLMVHSKIYTLGGQFGNPLGLSLS